MDNLFVFILVLAIGSIMIGWLDGTLIDNFTPRFQDLPDDDIDYNFFPLLRVLWLELIYLVI